MNDVRYVLTVNYLTSVLDVLEHFSVSGEQIFSDIQKHNNTYAVKASSLVSLMRDCRWVENDSRNISNRGLEVLSNFRTGNIEKAFRGMLFDYIQNVRPVWSARIAQGRKEAAIFMPVDIKNCFYHAGLLQEELTDDIVSWWYMAAKFIRASWGDQKDEVGCNGEKLTLCYEHRRTGVKPEWVAFESNLVGYDVLSRVHSCDDRKLLIEVKASEKPIQVAELFLSENEYVVAERSENYRIHLWCLNGSTPLLAIVDFPDLIKLLPINRGAGRWTNARVPYRSFATSFNPVDFGR